MPEPISTTTGGVAASVGLMALLIGAFGPIAADVMMVVISALAGCFIALSALKGKTISQSIGFIVLGVSVSLVLSWALSSILVSWMPGMDGPYTPSVIAMLIGFSSNRLPKIFNALVDKAESKAGISEK